MGRRGEGEAVGGGGGVRMVKLVGGKKTGAVGLGLGSLVLFSSRRAKKCNDHPVSHIKNKKP